MERRPDAVSEPLLYPGGYKSTTDHEEEEDDEDDVTDTYLPPSAESLPQVAAPPAMNLSDSELPKSRSTRSITRLPPRAANPTLDFGPGRRGSTGSKRSRRACTGAAPR